MTLVKGGTGCPGIAGAGQVHHGRAIREYLRMEIGR